MQDGRQGLTVDFATVPAEGRAPEIGRLCDAMEATYQAGCYPRLTVVRPWYPDGLPAAGFCSPDEPLLGLAGQETSERAEPASP